MVIVDQVYMAMAEAGMPVRVAVRLRPLPAFVGVIMMFVMHMQMVVSLCRVHVKTLGVVLRRPDEPGGKR